MRIIDFTPDANAPLRKNGQYNPQAPVVELSSHSRFRKPETENIKELAIFGALLPFPPSADTDDDDPSVA